MRNFQDLSPAERNLVEPGEWGGEEVISTCVSAMPYPGYVISDHALIRHWVKMNC